MTMTDETAAGDTAEDVAIPEPLAATLGGATGPLQVSAKLRPTRRLAELVDVYEQGRAAARRQVEAANGPTVTVQGPDGPVTLYRIGYGADPADRKAAAEEAKAKRTLLRRDALLACLTEKRMNCMEGLSVLYADQRPEEIQAWLDDPDQRTLILAGKAGNGKTQAAFAAAAQAARYGAMTRAADGSVYRKPLVVRGAEIEDYLRELRPEGSPEPNWAVRNRAIWAELYVGDDLGAEMDGIPSEFVRKELVSLLGKRLERHGRQIFTTNCSSEALKTNLGSRIWSRLQEQSTILVFTGPDRRVTTELEW